MRLESDFGGFDESEDMAWDELIKEMDASADSYETTQENILDTVRSAACPEGTPKLDSDYSGYMELEGAEKDGDCKIVDVKGGVSKELGCCNLFHPADSPKKFTCGTCKYEKSYAD